MRSRCLARPLTGRAALARDRARAQHPLYATANSTYGSGTASEFEKISQWHGQKARTAQRAQRSVHSAARAQRSAQKALRKLHALARYSGCARRIAAWKRRSRAHAASSRWALTTCCLHAALARAQGEFTKTAAQRAPPNTGFSTGIDKPRVHKDVQQ